MNMGQAAQLSKGLAKQYRAVLAQAEAMEGIASLDDERDRAMREAKDAVEAKDVAIKNKKEAEKEFKKVVANKEMIELISKKKLEDVSQHSYDIIEKAKKDSNERINSAKASIDFLIKEQDKEISFHKDNMEKLNKEKADLASAIKGLRDEFSKLRERLG